jgi:hypothetical protein
LAEVDGELVLVEPAATSLARPPKQLPGLPSKITMKGLRLRSNRREGRRPVSRSLVSQAHSRALLAQLPHTSRTERVDTVHPRCARVPCWPARTRKRRCSKAFLTSPPHHGTRGGEVRNSSKARPVSPAGQNQTPRSSPSIVGLRPPSATLRAAHDSTGRQSASEEHPVRRADWLRAQACRVPVSRR